MNEIEVDGNERPAEVQKMVEDESVSSEHEEQLEMLRPSEKVSENLFTMELMNSRPELL